MSYEELSEVKVEAILDRADVNKDRKLDYHEFKDLVSYCTQQLHFAC